LGFRVFTGAATVAAAFFAMRQIVRAQFGGVNSVFVGCILWPWRRSATTVNGVYHPELRFEIQPAFQVVPATLKQAGFVGSVLILIFLLILIRNKQLLVIL